MIEDKQISNDNCAKKITANKATRKSFYAGILEKHEPPSASLREAQMEIRKQTRWKSPYYWGAFVIEGD